MKKGRQAVQRPSQSLSAQPESSKGDEQIRSEDDNVRSSIYLVVERPARGGADRAGSCFLVYMILMLVRHCRDNGLS